MVDDYSRFIGLPRRKPKPAIGAWGSESDLLPGDPGFTPEPQAGQDFDAWMADARARGMFDEPAASTQAAGDEASPLMAQLMGIKGPGEVMTPESVQAAKQAYAARGGEFARGRLPTVEAAKAGEDAAQRERMERLERQAQGAADTSKATSSDGPPDTAPLYRQAFLDQLENVTRAARGEPIQRVVSPELAARDELAKWLAGKREREAGAAKLAQEERLEQMRALLGLAREEAATGRTKMQTEADVKRAEIAAGAKAAPKGVIAEPGAPKPAKPPKDAVELDEDGNIVPSTLAAARLAMKKAAVSAPRGYKVADSKLYGGQAFQDVEQAREFRKALGAVRALKNHREHALTALETMRKAPFPSKQFDTALGVLNQQMGQVSSKLRAAEGVPNTEGMQLQVEAMLSLTHGSAANVRNFMNSDRLPALLDSAVESAETNLGSLEEAANLVKEAGNEKEGEHGAAAAGDVVLVDKSDGREATVPKSEADDYVKADPARFSIKGG